MLADALPHGSSHGNAAHRTFHISSDEAGQGRRVRQRADWRAMLPDDGRTYETECPAGIAGYLVVPNEYRSAGCTRRNPATAPGRQRSNGIHGPSEHTRLWLRFVHGYSLKKSCFTSKDEPPSIQKGHVENVSVPSALDADRLGFRIDDDH
jgi:hypothetical protein